MVPFTSVVLPTAPRLSSKRNTDLQPRIAVALRGPHDAFLGFLSNSETHVAGKTVLFEAAETLQLQRGEAIGPRSRSS